MLTERAEDEKRRLRAQFDDEMAKIEARYKQKITDLE